MTNSEKITKIMEYVCKQISNLETRMNDGGFSSAEWIYLKAKHDTLFATLKNIEKITESK